MDGVAAKAGTKDLASATVRMADGKISIEADLLAGTTAKQATLHGGSVEVKDRTLLPWPDLTSVPADKVEWDTIDSTLKGLGCADARATVSALPNQHWVTSYACGNAPKGAWLDGKKSSPLAGIAPADLLGRVRSDAQLIGASEVADVVIDRQQGTAVFTAVGAYVEKAGGDGGCNLGIARTDAGDGGISQHCGKAPSVKASLAQLDPAALKEMSGTAGPQWTLELLEFSGTAQWVLTSGGTVSYWGLDGRRLK